MSTRLLIIDVVTLFPEIFEGFLSQSIVGRAVEKGLVQVRFANPRDFTTDKHKACDDTPYGGGGGMVMKPEPLARCLDQLLQQSEADSPDAAKPSVIFMCPQGRVFNQPWALELAGWQTDSELTNADEPATTDFTVPPYATRPQHHILVCGRYEAIDERIYDLYATHRLSIGDFILSGGEPAAMIVIDALIRLLPGSLGCSVSAQNDSFSAGCEGLLDAPHYTRPEVFRGLRVPDVLLSGNHKAIAEWRTEQSRERTTRWRPDLLPADEK
jgi:tRNA (guanine37-N1)-methyltransferase